MANSFSVKVLDSHGEPVIGKTVSACKQGFDKSCYRVTTDANGTATFNITAWNETIQITAEGLTNGQTSVNVDFFGNAKPEFQTLHTTFNPAGSIGRTTGDIVSYVKGLGYVGIIIVALVIGLILYLMVKKSVSSGNLALPSGLPKIPK